MRPPDRVAEFLDQTFDRDPPARIGVACSGGGDSMALLHLVARWARERQVACQAVTVDHGLRPEARTEATLVAEACEGLRLRHETLQWQWDGQGNLQDAARRGRLSLIAGWAREHELTHVCVGHTEDDQAETLVMRLARGSGVDGLAGMRAERQSHGITWLRPLLNMSRQTLRDWLRAEEISWAEDPSNDDTRFDRVRARQAIATLGLDPARLGRTARQMQAAEAVLHRAMLDLAQAAVTQDDDALLLDRAALRAALPDTRWRLVAAALQYIGGAAYRPRFAPLEDFTAALLDGEGRTLAGVRSVRAGAAAMRLAPEHGPDPSAAPRDNFHRWLATH